MIRWVASYPKSGNTWVRLFLVAYADPSRFDMNQRPIEHKQDTDWRVFERLSPVPLEEMTGQEALAIRQTVLVWLNRMASPMYLKSHCANFSVDGTALIPAPLTESGLYLVRDPRDVAVSYADHLGTDLDTAIGYMNDFERVLKKRVGIIQPISSWSFNVKSWLRKLPYDRLSVRYEDLLDDPEFWFREILHFFGVVIDKQRFQQALDMTAFDALKSKEDEVGYNPKSVEQKRFFRSGKVGAWRSVLSAEQVKRIELDHGEVMKMCNYELDF